MAAARQELEARPDDPLALLDVAAATLRLYEDFWAMATSAR